MNHDNCPICQLGQPCREHRVIGDGQGIRVQLTMMDSMQRAQHDRLHGSSRPAIPEEVRAQARVDHALWEAQQRQGAAPVLDAHYREVLDAKGRQVAAQLREIADSQARRQAHADHWAEQDAARQREWERTATPSDRAYADMCAGLDFRGRG